MAIILILAILFISPCERANDSASGASADNCAGRIMHISGWQLSRIKHYEGFRPEAYLCPAGEWTVGYGHTSGVKRGMVVNKQQAAALLIKDVRRYEVYVDRLLKWRPTQFQFDPLVDHSFNIGGISGGLRKAALAQNHLRVAYKLSLYNKARIAGRLRTLPGLVERANERKLRYLGKIGP